MKMFKPVTLAVMAASLALTGCVTNAAGEQQACKTAVDGLGGADGCGDGGCGGGGICGGHDEQATAQDAAHAH